MTQIDVNSDLGESIGGIAAGDDAAIIECVSSANVACGFHSGNPPEIGRTLEHAARRGVAVGAHVGYRDLHGFGRRFIDYDEAELADEVLYQIGALDALARSRGTHVAYVKPHGALYNAIVHHQGQARAVINGIKAFSAELPVLLLPGGVAVDIARRAGLRAVGEAFADRNYNPDGTLVSRREPDAVITDRAELASRVVRLAVDKEVVTRDGSVVRIEAESLCIHGDSPAAVDISRHVVAALTEAGLEIRSFL